MGFQFIIYSLGLGVGLAMDAFSVSLANGLNDKSMKTNKMIGIAGVFAIFQALMPMIGWVCVHTIAQIFTSFQKFIPWIALILLVFIGGKMLIEGITKKCDCELSGVGFAALMLQGVATSIDALSVGFTISDYDLLLALLCALIIAVVTFIICMFGLFLGKKFGTCLAGKASILGGAILIVIGINIFLTGIFG